MIIVIWNKQIEFTGRTHESQNVKKADVVAGWLQTVELNFILSISRAFCAQFQISIFELGCDCPSTGILFSND